MNESTHQPVGMYKRNALLKKYAPTKPQVHFRANPHIPKLEDLLDQRDRLVESGDSRFKRMNFAPLRDEPNRFSGMSIMETLEKLYDLSNGPLLTIPVEEFFDGNNDTRSIAVNMAAMTSYPSFAVIRDTLLAIRSRSDVVDVRVSIGEWPSMDDPGEAQMWPSADDIFIWTSAKLSDVKGWIKPLQFDSIALAGPKLTARIAGQNVTQGAKVYVATWD